MSGGSEEAKGGLSPQHVRSSSVPTPLHSFWKRSPEDIPTGVLVRLHVRCCLAAGWGGMGRGRRGGAGRGCTAVRRPSSPKQFGRCAGATCSTARLCPEAPGRQRAGSSQPASRVHARPHPMPLARALSHQKDRKRGDGDGGRLMPRSVPTPIPYPD